MIEHTSPISGIASFSDQYISTAGYDNQVILWDAQSKTALGRGIHDHLANQCRFSHDGRFLVSSSSDHTARVWEVPSMKLLAVLPDHGDDVEAVAIAEDNALIATCSRDHNIRLFNHDGELIRVLKGHTQDVISVEWIGNQKELISSSDDGSVKRWNTDTGEIIEDIDLGGVETDTVVISRSGVVFAANDEGEIISIYRDEHKVFPAHKAGIKRLVYSKETHALVSLSYDRSVKIWQINNETDISKVKETEIPSIVWPRSCCFIGKTQLAFATFGSCYATFDCDTMTWDLSGINATHGINAVCDRATDTLTIGDAGIVRDHLPQQSTATAMALKELPSLCNFLLDVGGTVITGGQTGEIFDALSGEVIYQHHSPLNCGTTYNLHEQTFAAVGAYTGDIIILRAHQQTMEYYATVSIQDNAIKGLCNDGQRLFSVSATGQASWHRLEDFSLIQEIPNGHDKISNGCAALSDNLFASVSRDLKLRLWQGSHCEVFNTPLTFSIKCIAALPEHNLVALGSYGGQVALFDYANKRWVQSLRPTTAGISNICAMSDQRGFIASSYDGRLHEILL